MAEGVTGLPGVVNSCLPPLTPLLMLLTALWGGMEGAGVDMMVLYESSMLVSGGGRVAICRSGGGEKVSLKCAGSREKSVLLVTECQISKSVRYHVTFPMKFGMTMSGSSELQEYLIF